MSALTVLFASLTVAWVEQDPTTEQLQAWVSDLSHQQPAKRAAAHEALVKAGPKAATVVPELIQKVGAPANLQVVEILGAIGPKAKEALPVLMKHLEPSDVGYATQTMALAIAQIAEPKAEATRALLLSRAKATEIFLDRSQYLRQYPKQVVPHVVAFCADSDADVRWRAAVVLGNLNQRHPVGHEKLPKPLIERAGDGAKGVPDVLTNLLADKSPKVRLAAALAISRVVPNQAKQTVPVIVKLAADGQLSLKTGTYQAAEIFRPVPDAAAAALVALFDSDDDSLRGWAMYTLAELPVEKALAEALKTGKTARTREAAATALGARYAGDPVAANALKAALADREFIVRFAAAGALVPLLRNDPKEVAVVVPVLVEGLKQKQDDIRQRASGDLFRIGSAAKAAVPELKQMLNDANTDVARDAAVALAEISPSDAADAVPVLLISLKDGPEHHARQAAKALMQIGEPARVAVPELLKKFDHESPHLRIAAAEAVARLDSTSAEKATDVLDRLLHEKKYTRNMVRIYTVQSLGRIGSAAKSAVPTLIELLSEDGPFHAEIAITALTIDPNAKAPRKWIHDRLGGDEDDDDTYDIVDLFAELGPKAKPYVPELIVLLQSKSQYFRIAAAETLGKIGPDAAAALPALKAMAAKDPRSHNRKVAEAAVKAIEKE